MNVTTLNYAFCIGCERYSMALADDKFVFYVGQWNMKYDDKPINGLRVVNASRHVCNKCSNKHK